MSETTSVRRKIGSGPATLALVECAIAGIVGISILNNPEAFAGASGFGAIGTALAVVVLCGIVSLDGLVWAIGGLLNANREAGASAMPAYCAIVLHGLLCLPLLIVMLRAG
ncbi:MAG: hypothetical protein IOC39_20305 [Burkholderia sp.]|jgi:hypothetical protein|uniref:hypothetical protein n=1 Tax=Burkholderia sp. TaxID=36773 RepID=UPI00258C7ECE|nr:hypothetical protein [Burkholderia sp.]MCA3643297.1 hypothetical protein [Methylobacterium sp.]MCA3781581.1 hypothetical protein [Burkholderia sp.]MCA3795714.1 hypothetical protein [Burkholderia sp.]MCA3805772.1 hypothetical protein [Burkholderia sp.]MCA3809382.1 hypothetical protein [Burkholderia sp.]